MSCRNDMPNGGEYTSGTALNIEEMGYRAKSILNERVDNAKTLVKYLCDKGWAAEAALGVAGVIYAESGINPKAYNSSEHKDGYAYKDKHAPNAKKVTYNGKEYYLDQASMMAWGYGKGIAQWSWTRNFKFRDWYNGGADGQKTSGIPTMDENAMNITGTTLTTQLAYFWHETQSSGRKGFREKMASIQHVSDGGGTSELNRAFEENIIIGVDAALRGYENGGPGFASEKFIDKYTWAGGYKGSMQTRVNYALGVYNKLKDMPDMRPYFG